MRSTWALFALLAAIPVHGAEDNRPLADRTRRYLTDLVRLETANPPGNETRVAEYLKQVADSFAIPAELLGPDPRRLNFVARLRGSGKGRPILLMAHSDVIPADRGQWTVDPFGAEFRNGYIYGRGAVNAKSLLAAELAVMVEIKRRNLSLGRDLILLAEADAEAGSSGIQWLIQHAWPKIDAEFALTQGGGILETKDGIRVFQVQTTEKIPTRIVLTAKGTAGYGSVPRPDNAVLHLLRAGVKLSEAEQPVRLNGNTRRYLGALSKLTEYNLLAPLLPRLLNPATAAAAANQIRMMNTELDSMLRTTVTPTMLNAGLKVNVIPSAAEAQLDVRRLPNETREEVLARFRQIINDPAVEITVVAGQPMAAADPSPRSTALYRDMERAINNIHPRDVLVIPFMSRGATDGSFLRARGVAVYGAPIFVREAGEYREQANDERITPKNLEDGVELLWQVVREAARDN